MVNTTGFRPFSHSDPELEEMGGGFPMAKTEQVGVVHRVAEQVQIREMPSLF